MHRISDIKIMTGWRVRPDNGFEKKVGPSAGGGGGQPSPQSILTWRKESLCGCTRMWGGCGVGGRGGGRLPLWISNFFITLFFITIFCITFFLMVFFCNGLFFIMIFFIKNFFYNGLFL